MLTILPSYNLNLLLNQHSVKQLFQLSEMKAIHFSHYHHIKQFEFYF